MVGIVHECVKCGKEFATPYALIRHAATCGAVGLPPRIPCLVCGLSHRAVCPSCPGVADILSAPTPEPVDYSLPACER